MSSKNIGSGRSTNKRATIDELNGGQQPVKKEDKKTSDAIFDELFTSIRESGMVVDIAEVITTEVNKAKRRRDLSKKSSSFTSSLTSIDKIGVKKARSGPEDKGFRNAKNDVYQMSFEDLSDIAIMQVMDKLDLRSRLSMGRVNKRMNGLQLHVKNELKSIQLNLNEDGSCESIRLHPCTDGDIDYNKIQDGLPRLLLNTHIQTIRIECVFLSGEECSFLNKFIEDFEKFEAEEVELIYVPDGSFPFLLSLAEKFRKVSMNTSVSDQELSIIRKKMIDGDCKLKSFEVDKYSSSESFMEECFGITIEDVDDGLTDTTIFHSVDESGELYAPLHNGIPSRDRMCHIEGDIKTTIDDYTITIEKCDGGAKPVEGYVKVKMNHSYEYEEDSFDEAMREWEFEHNV